MVVYTVFYTQQSPWIHQHHQTNITTKYRLHHFREGIFGGILLQDTLFKTEEYHTLHHHQSSFKKIIANEGLSSLPPILSFSVFSADNFCLFFFGGRKTKIRTTQSTTGQTQLNQQWRVMTLFLSLFLFSNPNIFKLTTTTKRDETTEAQTAQQQRPALGRIV